MKWVELSVQAPTEFVDPLSQIFYRYGHGGVAIEESGGYNPDEGESPPKADAVTIRTYLPVNSSTQERRTRIDLGVRLIAHISPISPLQERILDEDEWQAAWKEHFHVLRVGRRTVIVPSWRTYTPEAGDIIIHLDPGMAFGTGHHPTTKTCLEVLEHSIQPGAKVLDLGCGSGILSIAAAKLGAGSVVGLELDSAAVSVAKRNIRDNDVGHLVRIFEGTLPHGDSAAASFDLAVANISAKVVCDLATQLVESVRQGGTLIASGMLRERTVEVSDALAAAGAVVEETFVDGDWVAMVATVR